MRALIQSLMRCCADEKRPVQSSIISCTLNTMQWLFAKVAAGATGRMRAVAREGHKYAW
jgi:hypothetical protein